jgi:hypothetical protein
MVNTSAVLDSRLIEAVDAIAANRKII